MKKQTYLLLAALLLITLSGCSKEKPYKQGLLTETGYENEYLNLRFTLPEGAELLPEEHRDKYTTEVTMPDNGQHKMDERAGLNTCEMIAWTPGVPMFFISTKMEKNSMTADEYIDYLIVTNRSISESSSVETIELAGRTFTKLSTDNSSASWDYLYSKCTENSFVCISVQYNDDTQEQKDALLQGFTQLHDEADA